MGIKVISFDIFQTLVDVNKRIPQIWNRILGSDYTVEKAYEGANAVITALPDVMRKALNSREHFYTMQEVYEICIQNAVRNLSFTVNPELAVTSLLAEHAKAPYYEETFEVIQKLKKRYQVILCSDSNHIMVDEIIEQVRPSLAFISDDLKAYKADNDGLFFSKVISMMNVSPSEMLHVGDSYYDIIGANRAGIKSILIHRNHTPVKLDIKPFAVITNLNEIFELLV